MNFTSKGIMYTCTECCLFRSSIQGVIESFGVHVGVDPELMGHLVSTTQITFDMIKTPTLLQLLEDRTQTVLSNCVGDMSGLWPYCSVWSHRCICIPQNQDLSPYVDSCHCLQELRGHKYRIQ